MNPEQTATYRRALRNAQARERRASKAAHRALWSPDPEAYHRAYEDLDHAEQIVSDLKAMLRGA